MKEYTKTGALSSGRAELHGVLQLTGAEVSVNELPAGASVPFVHSHKKNEEIYAVLEGTARSQRKYTDNQHRGPAFGA